MQTIHIPPLQQLNQVQADTRVGVGVDAPTQARTYHQRILAMKTLKPFLAEDPLGSWYLDEVHMSEIPVSTMRSNSHRNRSLFSRGVGRRSQTLYDRWLHADQ
jgi:hypothetical protein